MKNVVRRLLGRAKTAHGSPEASEPRPPPSGDTKNAAGGRTRRSIFVRRRRGKASPPAAHDDDSAPHPFRQPNVPSSVDARKKRAGIFRLHSKAAQEASVPRCCTPDPEASPIQLAPTVLPSTEGAGPKGLAALFRRFRVRNGREIDGGKPTSKTGEVEQGAPTQGSTLSADSSSLLPDTRIAQYEPLDAVSQTATVASSQAAIRNVHKLPHLLDAEDEVSSECDMSLEVGVRFSSDTLPSLVHSPAPSCDFSTSHKDEDEVGGKDEDKDFEELPFNVQDLNKVLGKHMAGVLPLRAEWVLFLITISVMWARVNRNILTCILVVCMALVRFGIRVVDSLGAVGETKEGLEDIEGFYCDSARSTKAQRNHAQKPSRGAVMIPPDVLQFRDVIASEVAGDGRCLFRALSRCMYVARLLELNVPKACLSHQSEMTEREAADKLRKEVTSLLPVYRDMLLGCSDTGDDFGAYIEHMKLPTTFGGEPEIFVLTHLLQAPIAIYVMNPCARSFRRLVMYGAHYDSTPYCIWYRNRNHYDALLITVSDGNHGETEMTGLWSSVENLRILSHRK